jgi:hypothetical protein
MTTRVQLEASRENGARNPLCIMFVIKPVVCEPEEVRVMINANTVISPSLPFQILAMGIGRLLLFISIVVVCSVMSSLFF